MVFVDTSNPLEPIFYSRELDHFAVVRLNQALLAIRLAVKSIYAPDAICRLPLGPSVQGTKGLRHKRVTFDAYLIFAKTINTALYGAILSKELSKDLYSQASLNRGSL